jgi:hypothetical protein
MTAKVKTLSVVLAVLAAPWGVATVGLAGRASWFRQGNINSLRETDAAYRDGIFWGERDARDGRKLQPSMARWNDEKDRASFKIGYEKGYRQALDSRSPQRRR